MSRLLPEQSKFVLCAQHDMFQRQNQEAKIAIQQPIFQCLMTKKFISFQVVQLGLRLPAPSVPTMKFIDLETILQRPGTSSSANTLITSPFKGSANAEHRIVVLEGASQNFQNAMTLSLKKVSNCSKTISSVAFYSTKLNFVPMFLTTPF